MKKYLLGAIIVVLVALLLKTNEMEVRKALNLPIPLGSTTSYSMDEFKEKYGWGISDFKFNDDDQTFSCLFSTDENTTLNINSQFIIEKITFPSYNLMPEIMNAKSYGDAAIVQPQSQMGLTTQIGKNNWGIGTYRAVLNIRNNQRLYHWVVIYKVDASMKINHIEEKMIEGIKF